MGEKIRQVRLARGLTQRELAEIAGVSAVTISKLETGAARSASSKTLLRLASALNTSLDRLFFGEGV